MAKLLTGLPIIACIAPLFIKGPDVEPIMVLDDWKFERPASPDGVMPAAGRTGATSAPQTTTPEQVQEMTDTVTSRQETIDQRKADMDEIARSALGRDND